MINKIQSIFHSEEKKRVLSNFFSLSVLQMANYILPLITLPYLIRVLGIEYFGLLAFASAIVAYFQVITNYGFNLTATRDISIYREDHNKVIEIFSSVMTIKFTLMIISLFLMSIVIFSFEIFLKNWKIYYLTFSMLVGQIMFPVWFFQGMEQMKYVTYLNILARIIFTVAIFIFIQEKDDFYLVPALNSLGYFVSGILSLYYVNKKFGVTFKLPNIKILKHQLFDGWYVFLSQLKTTLFSTTNTVILGVMTNDVAVGYFSAAEKLIRALASLQTPIVGALFPYMSRLIRDEKKQGIAEVIKIAKLGTVVYIVILGILFIFVDNVINLIYGKNMDTVIDVFRILLIIPLTIFLNNMFGTQILLNTGNDKQFFKVVLFTVLISLISVIPLTYLYSLYGTAASIVITELFIMFGMFFYAKKEMKLSQI